MGRDFVQVELNDKGRQRAAEISALFETLTEKLNPYCYSGSHWDRARQRLEEAHALAQRSAALDPTGQVDKLQEQRREAREQATVALSRKRYDQGDAPEQPPEQPDEGSEPPKPALEGEQPAA